MEIIKKWPRRTASDKVLRDRAINIAENPKNDGCQCGLSSMVYKFFDKKFLGGAVTRADKSANTSDIMTNQKLTEEF